ncbi:MAG: nucleoside hydrolase [Kiritimatiellae bacterium]|nr:nucleoside hydrolase [Kiritimatiellia bacterium]
MTRGTEHYTTYGTWAELVEGRGARYAPIRRISDPGTAANPAYTGFWFYGVLQFDASGRYALGMTVRFQDRPVQPTDRAEIGYFDLQDGNRWTRIGETTAWNWQQGCRLQWRPNSDEILWNDRSADGTRFVCRACNFKTGARRTLPRAIYDVSPDGRYALTQDFQRMKHPGTDYVGIPDPYAGQHAPAETGVWKIDLETGTDELLISLARMAQIAFPGGYTGDTDLYFFREVWNRAGTRFNAFLRNSSKPTYIHAWSVGADGTDVRYFYQRPSHTSWRDDRLLLEGYKWTLHRDDGTGQAAGRLSAEVDIDTDCAFVPGHEDDWVVANTYPLPNGYQHLFLYHIPTKLFVPLAKLRNTAPRGIYRVDLHGRLSRDGRVVCMDASHEGKGRQMYTVDIGYILDNPPAGGNRRRTARLNVIYESDFTGDCDDVAALALLHGLADTGDVRILACMVNTRNEYAPRALDAVNTFYGRPNIPIGVYKGPDTSESRSPYTQALATELPNALPANSGVPEAHTLYRQVLAAQPDRRVTIISAGFLDNLEALLGTAPDAHSPLDGPALVQAKVARLYVMGPYLEPYHRPVDSDGYRRGYNFENHTAAAKYVIANWPTEIKFAEGSLGHAMRIGGLLAGKPAHHPVRRAYELRAKNWDHHCADPAAVIYAAFDDDLFAEIRQGSVQVRASDGWTRWVRSPALNQVYSLPKASIHELEYLMNALLAKEPAPAVSTVIMHPAPGTVLYPGKQVFAKGLGKNLEWTVRKGSATGPVLGAGRGPGLTFPVPPSLVHGQDVVFQLRGDGGSASRTLTVRTQGLLGRYYGKDYSQDYAASAVDRPDYNWWTGAPHTLERIDGPIEFNGGWDSPTPLMEAEHVMVHWTGYIQPDYSEVWIFHTAGSAGVRLYVDNALLIDDWDSRPSRSEHSGAIRLSANTCYPIRLDCRKDIGAAQIHLSWSSASQAKQTIPLRNLFVVAQSAAPAPPAGPRVAPAGDAGRKAPTPWG